MNKYVVNANAFNLYVADMTGVNKSGVPFFCEASKLRDADRDQDELENYVRAFDGALDSSYKYADENDGNDKAHLGVMHAVMRAVRYAKTHGGKVLNVITDAGVTKDGELDLDKTTRAYAAYKNWMDRNAGGLEIHFSDTTDSGDMTMRIAKLDCETLWGQVSKDRFEL